MTSISKFGLSALFGALVLMPSVHASTVFTLTQDGCSGTCGTGPFGTITLVQTTPTEVTVTETLGTNERFAGTGAGQALEFNVAGPVTIANINDTTDFAIGPAPATASTFGTFLESVTCTTCQGGKAGNAPGPLSFTVTSASGVTIADFLGNTGGYIFAADIVGNNGNTGNVAAIGGGTVTSNTPEPLSMSLMGLGLLGIGLIRRRS